MGVIMMDIPEQASHVSTGIETMAVDQLPTVKAETVCDRVPTGIEPTIYGRALLDRSLVAFDELRQAVKDIELLSNPTAGELRIGSPVAIAAGFVVAVVERVSRRYPAVVFEVLAEDADSISRLLEERKVDVVLTRMFRPDVPENMHAQILYDDEPFVVAAGIQSPWTKRRKLKLADLAKEAGYFHLPIAHSDQLSARLFGPVALTFQKLQSLPLLSLFGMPCLAVVAFSPFFLVLCCSSRPRVQSYKGCQSNCRLPLDRSQLLRCGTARLVRS